MREDDDDDDERHWFEKAFSPKPKKKVVEYLTIEKMNGTVVLCYILLN
jgi:hypothetical protein